ncbi:MAG TPA: hypothetical protein VGF45_23690 [Polyangia bacterium]
MPLRSVTIDDLLIEDERSLATVAIYPRLKRVLRDAGHRFYVPARGDNLSWDRTVFLNLTYWGGPESGDVLGEPSLPADVVAHIAWHHLASAAVAPHAEARPTPRALLFGESIASAYDLFLLGHLLERAPQSDFVVSQTPIIAEVAENAGVAARAFERLLENIAGDPARAFEDLRALLLDAATALLAAPAAPAAQTVLEGFADHRFACLLHHYQLSNWILYGRAYGAADPEIDARVAALDANLRQARPSSLAWLEAHWLPGEADAATPKAR